MDYKRYGANDNPYKPLLPSVGDVTSLEPIHPIDPDRLATSLSSAISSGNLAAFVIAGTSGSGRTAVARYIMSVYIRAFEQLLPQLRARGLVNGPTRERCVAYYERGDDGNVDGRQVAREILEALLDEVTELGADLEAAVAAARQRLAALRIDYSAQNLQSIARAFSSGVHVSAASFTCSVENVPNIEVFRAIRAMFAKSKGLLICTIVAERRDAILGTLKPDEIGDEITLGNLPEDRICTLAAGRWHRSHATPPLPFRPPGLENAFHDNRRTVGKSLETLAYMINAKLTAYPGRGVHPSDGGLAFEEEEIRNHIELFDRRLK